MDFKDILEQWEALPASKYRLEDKKNTKDEKQTTQKKESHINDMERWLRIHGVQDKDADESKQGTEAIQAERRRYLKNMHPEATIDLHGLTANEAWIRLESFIFDCVRNHFDKVLIIHGKGNHSENSPVLAKVVQEFIEKSAYTGASGHPKSENGGNGATWIILKKH